MECAQLNITGGGSTQPSTVSFPGAYAGTDPGIKINIYQVRPSSLHPIHPIKSCPKLHTKPRRSQATPSPDLQFSAVRTQAHQALRRPRRPQQCSRHLPSLAPRRPQARSCPARLQAPRLRSTRSAVVPGGPGRRLVCHLILVRRSMTM